MKNRPSYLQFGNTLGKYLVVGITRHGERGLPKNLNDQVINDLMVTVKGEYAIGLTTSVIAVPNIEASKAINTAEDMVVANQKVERDSNSSDHVSFNTRSDLGEISEVAAKIYNQDEKMMGMAFIISILAESEEAMNSAMGHVQQVLGAKLIRSESPVGNMEETMHTALPFPVMPNWIQGDPLTKQAAVFMAAQNTKPYSDTKGLRMGLIKGTKSSQYIVDLDSLPAEHMLWIGQTGSGKTTAVLTMMERMFTELGYTCVFITAKADEGTNHRHVPTSLGEDGAIIDIGPGEHSINPLQIVYTEEYVKDTPYGWASVVHQHISLITRFFAVFLEEGMSPPKRSYINETLLELYESRGIYVDRPDTLREALKTAEWPHMADLIDLWKRDSEISMKGDKSKTVLSMVANTFQLTRKGALSYINRDSDIKLKRFTVIDISAVGDDMREAMNVFVTGLMWQKFRSTRESGRKTIIAIDEAREFLKNPTTRIDLVQQLTQARSNNVCVCMMTQQLSDISKNDVSDEVRNNIFVNVAFGPGGDESKIPLVKDYYNFSDREAKEWVLCGVGEAMVMCRGAKVPVEFKLTDYELDVIKGRATARDEPTNQSLAIGSIIDVKIRDLVEENGFCLASWCNEGTDEVYFKDRGWVRGTFNSATGAGLVKAWTQPNLIRNGKVGSQSEDHYATVLQIAGYLLMAGISETIVHHTDNVDISSKIGEEWIAVEFEKPRSHTKDELMNKQRRAEVEHSVCYFVGVTENIPFLRSAVVKQNVIARGTNLRRLMDNLIEERT
jgi:peroxiredoxin family protein